MSLLSGRGSLSLEAMLALAALLALIGSLIGLWQGISVDARGAENSVLSFAEAESCAVAADVLFANAGGVPAFRADCVLSGNSASAGEGESVSSTRLLSDAAEFDGTVLRVKVNAHYK